MSFRLTALLLFFSIITLALRAQSIPDSIKRKIDSLFKTWDTYNSPGCAVGVVRNDTLIYAKGYGMANLEYDVRITPETIFHMASISKQFTAFSIVLLARAGKLSLDDDIHKYLTWFPDMKETITIRHLLHHTSGIRDQWQLLAIAGTRLDDVITQDQIVKILSKQQALNFKPGEQHSYSNSGYTMLAEIVKSVTGQTLRVFTDSAIFKPLGMNHTHFHDDYTEIEKNRAYSYERVDSLHFTNAILSYSNAGATSLFTNVEDMSKWVMNFFDHTVGDQKDIDELTRKGKLNNGKEINYAEGIVVDKYNGWRQYQHSGADAGYRTYMTVLPDLKMGFIAFSNLGDLGPWDRVQEIASLFVKDTAKTKATDQVKKADSSTAVLKDIATVRKDTGTYIGDDGLQMSFRLSNKKLYADLYGRSFLLMPGQKDSFAFFTSPEVRIAFSNAGEDTTAFVAFGQDEVHVLKKYIADTSQPDELLQAYTGTYYSPELDCKYGIVLKNHHLVLTNNKYNDAKLTLIGNNHLLSGNWWMDHLQVLFNEQKKVTGFEVNSGRIKHLKFDKIE